MKKNVITAVVLIGVLIGAGTSFAYAESHPGEDNTLALLQEQINALLVQVQELQAQLAILRGEQASVQQEIKELRLEARQLRVGITGEDVKLLQEILATDPEIYPQGLITGFFGPLTKGAVIKFQKKFGIEQVGEVGPITRRKLNELLTTGAGKSGKVPPGLLIAPGIAKKLGGSPAIPTGQKLPPGIAKKLNIPDPDDGDDGEDDITDPIVNIFSPLDDATDVAVDTNLVITFSETVVAGTGSITVTALPGDILFESTDVASSIGTGTDTITIDLVGVLAFSTEYYVQIDATAFDDTAGNSYAGIADKVTWNFTTVAEFDTVAPTVAALLPLDDATDVAVDTDLVITFSEIVVAGTGNVSVSKASDGVLFETVDVASTTGTGTDTITIGLIELLALSTEYYVQIDATAFEDTSANPYAGISSSSVWSFTTTASTVE